jgi:hypothetical protein
MEKGSPKSVDKAPRESARKTEPDKMNQFTKVGSDRSAAAHFAGHGDFGIPAGDAGRFPDVAAEAKYQPAGDHQSDPRPPRSGGDEDRESGVGGFDSGPGSNSGGDLDTDVVGVGTHGVGIATSGPDDRKQGADMTESASNALDPHPHQPRRQMRSSTVDQSGGDNTTTGHGNGAGTVTPFETGDDAAAGEISQGEAAGDDNTDIDNMS